MHENTWVWIRKGFLKKETEGLICAAQEQAIRTSYIKAKIDKSQGNERCRMCGVHSENVMHLVCGCTKIAQTRYTIRHDKVAAHVHWQLCMKFGFEFSRNWYEHIPEPVIEYDGYRIH